MSTRAPALQEAMTYLRGTIAGDPGYGNQWTVINMEYTDHNVLVLDLDDGTTIRLDVSRYPTDSFDLGRRS